MSNSPQINSIDIKTIFNKYRRKVILRAVIVFVLLITNLIIAYLSFESLFNSHLVGILLGIFCCALTGYFADLKVIISSLQINNNIQQIEAKLNSQERLSTIVTSDINSQNDPRIKYIQSQLTTIINEDTNNSLQVRYNVAPFGILITLLILGALCKQVTFYPAINTAVQKSNDIDSPQIKSLQEIVSDQSIEAEIRDAVQAVVTSVQNSDYKQTGKLSSQTLEAIKQATEKIEEFEKTPKNTNQLSPSPTPTPTVTPNKEQQSKTDKDQKQSQAEDQNKDQQNKDQQKEDSDKKENEDNKNGSGDQESKDQKSQNNQGDQEGQKEDQKKDNQNGQQANKEDNKQGNQSNKDQNKDQKKDENKEGNKEDNKEGKKEGKKEDGKEPSNEGNNKGDKEGNKEDNKQEQEGNQPEGQGNKNQPQDKQGDGPKLDQAKKALNDLKKKNDQEPEGAKSEPSKKPQSNKSKSNKNKDSKSGDQSGTGDSKIKDQELSLLGEGDKQINNQIVPKKIEEKKLGNPDEKTDERYTSDEVKISDNKDPAKPKTQLGQFDKLGQQEVQDSTADKIPLEYKEFLTR